MHVNEEIDALQTLGISPMEFLVLPRMVALIVMMPLLCLYADLMGIVGGMIVGLGMLDLGLTEYLLRTREAVKLTYVWIGLFHSAVFGVLVALSGCLRGMQCGRSASAVGEATTSAVVTNIVAMILATAVAPAAAAALTVAVTGFWLLRQVEKPGLGPAVLGAADKFEISYVNVGGAPAQTFIYEPQGSDVVLVWAAKKP